jgi:hypothetical protein
MTVKVHDLFARKANTTMEQFSHYWTTRHAEVAKRFPQIRHYIQSHRIQEEPVVASWGQTWPDGCAETWYVDPASLQEMVSLPRFSEELMEDETHFMELGNPRPLLVSDEHFLDSERFDPGDRGVKLLLFARRPQGTDPSAFMAGWARDDDVGLGRTLGATRHVVCTPVRESGVLVQSDLDEGRSDDLSGGGSYDGVRELWWPSQEALEASVLREPEAWAELLRASVIDAPLSMSMLTRERVIIA